MSTAVTQINLSKLDLPHNVSFPKKHAKDIIQITGEYTAKNPKENPEKVSEFALKQALDELSQYAEEHLDDDFIIQNINTSHHRVDKQRKLQAIVTLYVIT